MTAVLCRMLVDSGRLRPERRNRCNEKTIPFKAKY